MFVLALNLSRVSQDASGGLPSIIGPFSSIELAQSYRANNLSARTALFYDALYVSLPFIVTV